MLRKSPYVEENYNYITSMMNGMDIQGNPQDFAPSNPSDTMPNQFSSLFCSNNQHSIFNPIQSTRKIDEKKHVEVTDSVYDKTLGLLHRGAIMAENQPSHTPFPMACELASAKPDKIKCFGCLREKSDNSMHLEGNDTSQFSQCSYCRTSSCLPCTRRCDVCWRNFCKICVAVRYEEFMDKTVCMYCS